MNATWIETREAKSPTGIRHLYETVTIGADPDSPLCNMHGSPLARVHINHMFLWFETHLHLIKRNIPDDPRYAHVHTLDEVDVAMRIIGPKKFPPFESKRDPVYIWMTLDEIAQLENHLGRMGVSIDECREGACFSCQAYHALLEVRSILF